ncbi:MAG: LacI family DNA-binding transcriptional regulator [Lachnospiraceae bacterium]|nr:LacI family DNA-binding transcriptional regulator [Lachnospiraceae bacterium]
MSIKKIAEQVGVSCSTVSRVLNNPNYRCSSEEIREKIWEAAMEHNYTPNEAARSLKLGLKNQDGNTFYISVLMTRTDANHVDPFFSELLRVIESEIHRNICILSKIWYEPVFSDDKRCQTLDIEKKIEEMCKDTKEKNDGLIIIGKCNIEALKILNKKYKSVVSVNRNSTNYQVDEVLCDGRKVAAMAVEYLVQLGHTQIGYVGACHNESRYRGFLDVVEKYNLKIDPAWVLETNQTEVEGFEAMKKFLGKKGAPTGIYCANDITAIGMLKCLQQYKNRYYHPSIIASDDIEEAQNTKPMLTTVGLPKEEMGKFALYLLVDRLKGGHKVITRLELEGKLMIRNSCSNYESN